MGFVIIISLSLALLIACNNRSADEVAKADSANRAILDSGLQHNQVVIDEASADFLVRFSNIVAAEKEIASIAMHEGISPTVKDFAATLYRELSGIMDSIVSLRSQKNIVLPSIVSGKEKENITLIKTLRGEKLDKAFLKYVVDTHTGTKKLFQQAMTDVKDEEIRAFADISEIIFKKYLNEASRLTH